MFRDRRFVEQGINNYVPAMQYSCSVKSSNPQVYNLGSPAANAVIQSGVSGQGAIGTTTTLTWTSDARYGRSLIYTPSGDPGASGGSVDVRGFDYLGQPMLERFSGSNGSSTPIVGTKAFYRLQSMRIVTTTTNAITWSITSGDRFGLPYRGDVTWARENGVLVAVAAQWVAAVTTDPATATTGDPRGTYNPTAAHNGATEFLVTIMGDDSVNASGNGGLHGIRHYYA